MLIFCCGVLEATGSGRQLVGQREGVTPPGNWPKAICFQLLLKPSFDSPLGF